VGWPIISCVAASGALSSASRLDPERCEVPATDVDGVV